MTMNFDLRRDLEKLANQSNGIVTKLCHCESQVLKEFKIKTAALLLDFFPKDSIFKKFSLFNEEDLTTDNRGKSDPVSGGRAPEMLRDAFGDVKNADLNDDLDDSSFKNTESGFFEASSGGTTCSSSSEKNITCDEIKNEIGDATVLRRSQNGVKKKPPMEDSSKESQPATSHWKKILHLGKSSSKNKDGGMKLLRMATDARLQLTILDKDHSLAKDNANGGTKEVALNTTYVISEETISTQHIPKEIPDTQLIRSKHLMYKFSHLQSFQRKWVDRDTKNPIKDQGKKRSRLQTEVPRKMNEPFLPIHRFMTKRHPLGNASREKEFSKEVMAKQSKCKVFRNKREVPKGGNLKRKSAPMKVIAANNKQRSKSLMNRAAILRKCNAIASQKNKMEPFMPKAMPHKKLASNDRTNEPKKNPKRAMKEIRIEKRNNEAIQRMINHCSDVKSGLNNGKSDVTRKKARLIAVNDHMITPPLVEAVKRATDGYEKVAPWAMGVRLKAAILRQHHSPAEFDPEDLFGPLPRIVRLEDIFGNAVMYHSRTSSADWST